MSLLLKYAEPQKNLPPPSLTNSKETDMRVSKQISENFRLNVSCASLKSLELQLHRT